MKAATLIAVVALIALAEACPTKPSTPFGQCPLTDGEMPTYLMDQDRRDTFYECSNGKAVAQSCPPGLVFNPNLTVCDYPIRGGTPYGPVGTCPRRDGFFLKYLRDGTDVTTFYICFRGKARMYKCREGLIFNTTWKTCLSAA